MLPFEHGQSWSAGRWFGVPIRLHWSLALMVGIQLVRTLIQAPSYLMIELAVDVLIIASIWFHEMGHALVGRSYGMRTLEMTLHAFGGFVRQSGQPSDRQQVKISAAGPITNILLWLLLNGVASVTPVYFVRAVSLETAWFNLAIGLFNLIPAFPLDGGAMLVHGLRTQAPYAQASWLAYSIGKWISAPLCLIGLVSGNLLLALIFFFTFSACHERLVGVGAVGGLEYWKSRLFRRRKSPTGPIHIDFQKYAPPGTRIREVDDDDTPPTIN